MMMWNELTKSPVSSSKSNSADKEVLKQFVLVTVTNVLCWLPSSAINIASLIMETYPTNLLIWNAILINPLNSVINPIIFCIFPIIKNSCKNRKVQK